jgi:hypothetical protein
MKETKWLNIAVSDGKKMVLRNVKVKERFEINGISVFLHCSWISEDGMKWTVSEYASGHGISKSKTIAEVKAKAKQRIISNHELVRAKIDEVIRTHGRANP